MTEHRALEAIKAYRKDTSKSLPLEVFKEGHKWGVIFEDGEEESYTEQTVQALEEEYKTN